MEQQSLNNKELNNIEKELIKNNQVFRIVAGVAMILVGLISVFFFIKNIIYNIDYYGWGWFYFGLLSVQIALRFIAGITSCVGFIGGAILLLTNKSTNLLKIFLFVISGSYVLYSLTCLVGYIISKSDSYYYSSDPIVPVFLDIAFAAIWVLNLLPLIKKDVNINFIVPIIASVVLLLINLVYYIIRYSVFINYVELLLSIIAVITCGLAVRYIDTEYIKEVVTMTNTQQNNYNQNSQQQAAYTQSAPVVQMEPEGYIKIWVLIVLSIVTFGIYTYYWIYKTTGTLNEKLPNSQPMNQVPQLLLCMFVPFYIIYWVYKTCKRIEEYSLRLNTGNNDLSLIGLLLTIFGFGIVAYALMQDQINKNIMIEAGLMRRPQPRTNDFVPQQIEPAPAAQPVPQAAPVQPIPQEAPVAPTPAPAPQVAPAEPEKKKIKVTKEQYESLLMIKELLDQDIITKEEFIQKKNEILG